MGGGPNAPVEISMLERDIANAKLSQDRIEGAIESDMDGLAAVWPSQGLTSDPS